MVPAWFEQLLPPCLLHTLTGYYCPGCGATRSVFFLLQGKVGTAFFYYPAVPVAAGLLLWALVSLIAERLTGRRGRFSFPRHRFWLYLLLALVVLNFVWKNAVLYLTGVALIA